MLKNILLNNPSKICAIIQDDNSVKGSDLFRTVLKHDSESDGIKEIHLISCENPPHYYTNVVNSKIIVHDLFSDPISWLQKNKFDCHKVFDEILNTKEISSTVMIDSLNFLILLSNEDYLCRTIHKLKSKFKKIICLLHVDEIASQETIRKLIFLSNVYLKLYHNKSKNMIDAVGHKRSKLVEAVHVKPSGKITSFKEIFIVHKDFSLHSDVYHVIKQNSSYSTNKDNFKNLTTFRLGLDIKENEKIARDNLVLPYLRSSNKDERKPESGEGKIVYYAESEDDLEDDPDDDLDI